jgi:hypothetical protein
MMLFRKGSLPEQLVVRAPLDLIVTFDDARSALYSIFSGRGAGSASSM